MWPWPRPKEEAYPEVLNHLKTRIERLEIDSAERSMIVLTTVEKVLHQLRARVKKRERDLEAQDAPGAHNEKPDVSQHPSRVLRTMRQF